VIGDLLDVAREHDGLLHARALEGRDGMGKFIAEQTIKQMIASEPRPINMARVS
jgi:CelD/BcsL family acetyltransferase involved in cellulose biosynthesis